MLVLNKTRTDKFIQSDNFLKILKTLYIPTVTEDIFEADGEPIPLYFNTATNKLRVFKDGLYIDAVDLTNYYTKENIDDLLLIITDNLSAHLTDVNAHKSLFDLKENIDTKGIADGYTPLNNLAKVSAQYLDIINNLTVGGITALLSAEQGKILKQQIDAINNMLSSDNVNLDTVQEIVDTIENFQNTLAALLVNDLETGGATKALTAEMGKFLDSIKENKSQKGIAGGYTPLDALQKVAAQYLNIVNDLTTGGVSSLLSAEQGKVLSTKIDNVTQDKNYLHIQTEPSLIWIIIHNLSKYPTIVIMDSLGNQIEADIKYNNINQVTITFSELLTGSVSLN